MPSSGFAAASSSYSYREVSGGEWRRVAVHSKPPNRTHHSSTYGAAAATAGGRNEEEEEEYISAQIPRAAPVI